MKEGKRAPGAVIFIALLRCAFTAALTQKVLNADAARVVGVGWGASVDVGVLLKSVADQHLRGCFLVLMTTWEDASVLRPLAESYHPSLMVDAARFYSFTSSSPSSSLLRHLKEGDGKFPCRVFLLDVTDEDSLAAQIRLLGDCGLSLRPGTKVVGVGPLSLARPLLTHPTLTNTAHALYLALPPPPVSPSPPPSTRGLRATVVTSDGGGVGQSEGEVEVYWRCLYCRQGEADLLLLDTWRLPDDVSHTSTLFPDQFRTFHGHKFRIVSMDWFPFLSFRRDSDTAGTTVTPQDSLDYRMLTAFAYVLNFTYVMRVPQDDQWGVSLEDGNWTGTVGTLQHQGADFSMLLSWMSSRLAVVDYSRVYVSEPLVVVTGKAGPLPQIFALVRPFPMTLWVWVLVVAMSAGLATWALHRGWVWVSDAQGKDLSLSSAFLNTWRILLEDPPPRLPDNPTSQMMLGWWWVFCMLLMAAYRSSLIAHLSVPDKSPTIDTLEQLLHQTGWTWGMEGTYGIGWEYFRKSSIPTVRRVYEKIVALDPNEHLVRVLRGRHAFLTWKYYIRTIISSQYTDALGYTPLHVSRTEYINFGGYGWGFRKGAPFLRSFDLLKQRLLEAGLVNHWMNELIEDAARDARTKATKKLTPAIQEASGRIVLGLQQLQGAFYLLGLGCLAAFLVLLTELLHVSLSNTTHKLPP